MSWLRPLAVIPLVVLAAGCGNGTGPGGGGTSGGGGGGAACGTSSTSGTGDATVNETTGLQFAPSATSVKVGQTVEWVNGGSIPHNVTFDTCGGLASSTMNQGDKFYVKFTTAGTYSYKCTFHAPGMVGKITVS